ncbi:MAG: type II toxin-antitoxin system VapC family toxin [Coriobacteriales bacterium]|jgi:predicted nucleic acid-binding protein|nr:type II toxin-antitoxin system VapC family toxin [Coriobacteriales bacterium]
MIIVDTNILSEPLKAKPNEHVLAWFLENQEDLYTTAITIGELMAGACSLPAGKRREGLRSAIEELASAYGDRALAYDAQAAKIYGILQGRAKEQGRPLSVEDGMIAALCLSHDAVLATHNTKDFERLGVTLTDPFTAPTPHVIEVTYS